MRTHYRRILTLAASILLIFASGCVSSKQEARKQAVAHWNQVRSGVTLQMAEQQLRQGQADRARDSVQEALHASPDDPQLHLLLARVLFELRDLSAAQASLSRAKALASDLPEVDYWQGVLAQAAGQWDEAHAAYQAASARRQDSAECLCALLEAKLALGHPREALDLAASRFRDFPREARLRALAGSAATQLGDLARAEELYEQAADLDPTGDEAPAALAQVLCLAGKYEQAAVLLEGLQAREARKDLRPMLAACHLACGRYEKAQDLYEACLADDPDKVSIQLRANEARLLAGRISQARQELQTLLQRRPNDSQGWQLLGHALALEGDFDQARRAYTQSVACGGSAEQLQEYIRAIDLRSPLSAAAAVTPAMTMDTRAVTRIDDAPAR